MKLALILAALITVAHGQFFGVPSLYHGPAHSHAGIFLPPVKPSTNFNNPQDVRIRRFCKAICYLYIDLDKTCGTNNMVYENACQARCDRVDTDDSRLMFNEKCCCDNNSHLIDAEFATDPTGAVDVVVSSSNFCIYRETAAGQFTNVFAIPQCIRNCLGIDSINDLVLNNTNYTYGTGCTVNANA